MSAEEPLSGGEQSAPPQDKSHEGAPHDQSASEPLGPFTPDEETDTGDTPEAHDEITPHDLPKDHPGRKAAEELAGESGTTKGNQ
jgi:hypothetical protein